MTLKILVSGFEPFADAKINPTDILVRAIDSGAIIFPSDTKVEAVVLPVTFSQSYDFLKKHIIDFNPDIILCFGLAARRTVIEVERVAINIKDTLISDNEGHLPQEQEIQPGGAAAYFSNIALRELINTLDKNGIKANISNSAGTYVCNYLYYKLLHDYRQTEKLCGFIHIPSHPSEAKEGEPFLTEEDLIQALIVIIDHFKQKKTPA